MKISPKIKAYRAYRRCNRASWPPICVPIDLALGTTPEYRAALRDNILKLLNDECVPCNDAHIAMSDGTPVAIRTVKARPPSPYRYAYKLDDIGDPHDNRTGSTGL